MSSSKFALLVAIFAVIGVALSYILIDHHVLTSMGGGNPDALCNLSATVNCDAAAKSRWSELFGIPIASFGLFFYVMLFVAALLSLDRTQVSERGFKDGVLFFSTVASIVSLFLLVVSVVDLKSICPYCLMSYVVNFALLGLGLMARRDEKLRARFVSGAQTALLLPLTVLGFRNSTGFKGIALARGMSLVAVIVFVGSVLLPMYLFSSKSAAGSKGVAGDLRAQMAVQAWLASPSVDLEVTLRPGTEGDQMKGARDGAVQIVQFTDYECPMCRRFHQTMQQLLAAYPTQVQFIHKDFPLDQSCNPAIQHKMHESACDAAQVARCAGEQDGFWKVADALYALPELDERAAPEAVLAAIYQRISAFGLDVAAVRECVASKRYQQKILDDIRLGNALHIPGTPSVFINGKPVQQLGFEALNEIVAYILKSRPG